MTTIFLTGGSGEIGSVLIRELAPSHKIKALFLNAPGAFTHAHVEWVQGDVTQPWTYESHLKGVNKIVHLAAQLRGGKNESYEKVNVKGTLELVKMAHEKGARHAIIASSASITQKPLSLYAQSKKKMEERLRHAQMPVTIIRPTLVYGPHSRYIQLFQKWVEGPLPLFFLPNNGMADIRPVHVNDVSHAIHALVKKPPNGNKTYDICPRTPFTLRQIIETVMEARGIKKPLVGVGEGTYAPILALLQKCRIPIPSLFSTWVAGGNGYTVNPEPFWEAYGIPFIDPREGIQRCVK
jgi:nucleoside-diphosphate-sugar epimerase